MRLMRTLIIAGGAYVLGAKAGHERYEQIVDVASKLWNSSPLADFTAPSRDTVDEIIVEDEM
ncbi:hypothetical protein [Arcanobacterium phocae]|uniref:Uncharacterized protein n=2 Tax=Arcanobacterium phocae TaxID=131112 RepID=A0A1H2LCF6_9ACTO|nr:hypothetical protein [Arcanobacterium phocae]SDU78106.1 hypothetical protein SAMN04489737_0325 [Arcanobacterium phocae]